MVSGRVPDLDSEPVASGGEQARSRRWTRCAPSIPATRSRSPASSVIAARNSASMIEKLNRGLTVEFLLVAIFIGLAFRSVVVMFSCILPGIFPVVLSGTVLWLLGEGLQFASVVALTVSFGLGLERHHPLPQPAAARDQAGYSNT